MLRLLTVFKIIVYILVITRTFNNTPMSISLLGATVALIISSFSKNLFRYKNNRLNLISLHFDLLLAFILSLLTQNGSFDKIFIVGAVEGIALLTKPYWIIYPIMAFIIDAFSVALYDLRLSGHLEYPSFAEILLYAFIIVVVVNERRQREQRSAYEKLAKELGYLNLQLNESIAWSESLASEMERRRIMGEIHDSLGHSLTGLIITLEAGRKMMPRDKEAAMQYWDKALQVSRMALNTVRELVSTGRTVSPRFELIPRLKDMVEQVFYLTGLKIELHLDYKDMSISEKEEFHIYRILQEAVTNTLRYGLADQATINISNNNEQMVFLYSDNGVGTEQIEPGNGLKGMMSRMSELNGTIDFCSKPGAGFIIKACLDKRGTSHE